MSLQDTLITRFEGIGMVLHDLHVVLKDGDHGEDYVNKDVLYRHPRLAFSVARSMAEVAKDFRPQMVFSAAVAGSILGELVAIQLCEITQQDIECGYADKNPDDSLTIKRGYDQGLRGKRIVVVEDVVTSGSTIRDLITLLKAQGAIVVAVVALWNRGGVTKSQLGVRYFRSLIELEYPSWSAEPRMECPLCKAGVPITTHVGKGKKYLEDKAKARAAAH